MIRINAPFIEDLMQFLSDNVLNLSKTEIRNFYSDILMTNQMAAEKKIDSTLYGKNTVTATVTVLIAINDMKHDVEEFIF